MRGVVLDDLRYPEGTGDPSLDRRLRRALEQAGADGPERADEGLRELHRELAERLGADHSATLSVRVHAALCLERRGDPVGAAVDLSGLWGELSVSIGPLHPHMLALQAEIARLWGESDLVDLAADGYGRLVTLLEQARGVDDPDSLAARERQAWWTGKTGQPEKAALAYADLLGRQRRALGPNHADVLESRGELVRWHAAAGDRARAARVCADQVAARERVQGLSHPDTLAALLQSTRLHADAGDPAGAARACAALLRARLTTKQPRDREVLNTRRMLAHHRVEAGDLLRAEHDYEELLPDLESSLPSDHRITLLARFGRARLLFLLGETDLTRSELARILPGLRRVLGEDHEDVLDAWFLLAASMVTTGGLEEALIEAEALLPRLHDRYGRRHHMTLFARAHVLEGRGDPAALDVYGELRGEWERVLGPTHPNTLLVRLRLATEGDLSEAVEWRALTGLFEEFRAALGPAHGLTVMFRALLITLEKDEATALSELGELYRRCVENLGTDAPGTRAALEAYTEWLGHVVGRESGLEGPDAPETVEGVGRVG